MSGAPILLNQETNPKNIMKFLLRKSYEYEVVPLEACNEFVTLLNLRNWARLGDRYVTEQIYVHSKVMIVDDLYALIGSANINDRSLLGERDSELAVLVMDGETVRANVNGDGSNSIVRRFAHELRVSLWRKIFGFLDGSNAAKELEQAILQPGLPDSRKCIQHRAARNAALFENAFSCIPGKMPATSMKTRNEYASILPTWNRSLPAPAGAAWQKEGGNIDSLLPFHAGFWEVSNHTPEIKDLINGARGFFTLLPINWTNDENVRFEFPSSLVADNEDSGGGGSGVNAINSQT